MRKRIVAEKAYDGMKFIYMATGAEAVVNGRNMWRTIGDFKKDYDAHDGPLLPYYDYKRAGIKLMKQVGGRVHENRQSIKDIARHWHKMNDPDDTTLVCTGCGHIQGDDLGPTAMACCPDSRYVTIRQFIDEWRK